MTRKNHRRVLVAGAGPAGLAAALFLHERGLDVEVVDEQFEPPDDDFAVILHPDTVQRLVHVGVPVGFGAQRKLDTVGLYDRGRRCATVRLDADGQRSRPAAVVGLRQLDSWLTEALRTRHVKIRRHHRLARLEVTPDRVEVEIDRLGRDGAGYAIATIEGVVLGTSHREYDYLIAADGRESVVRAQLDIDWRAVAEPEIVAAFEVECPLDLGHEVRAELHEGAAVMWPLGNGHLRITFHVPASTDLLAEHRREWRAPGRDDLIELLRVYVPWFDAPLGDVRWSHVERIEPAVAERHGHGRAWFVGDAAYRLVPAASQALNLGIREADDLAGVLGLVAREQAGPDALTWYTNRARLEAVRTARLAESYQPTAATDGWVASNLHRILPVIPAHGRELDHAADQLGLGAVAL